MYLTTPVKKTQKKNDRAIRLASATLKTQKRIIPGIRPATATAVSSFGREKKIIDKSTQVSSKSLIGLHTDTGMVQQNEDKLDTSAGNSPFLKNKKHQQNRQLPACVPNSTIYSVN